MSWNPAHIDPVPSETHYLLNVSPEAARGCEAYAVSPETPDRVFAGAETVFLRFANEAEARKVLAAYWSEGA